LTNAFRHAQSSRIELLLEYSKMQFRLICRDNGCGMDPKMLQQGRSGHWGLLGMRERAARIGARLENRTTPGSGTEIIVAVSARRAYAAGESRRWLHSLTRRIIR
jgi:signal transduction histidine kinase